MNSTANPNRYPQADAVAYLLALTVADVMSVYSGKPGCACGCRGNHRYNSKHVEAASKDRGYEVTSADVNDAQVKRVLNLMQKNAAMLDEWGADDNNLSMTLTSENGTERLYILYPVVK